MNTSKHEENSGFLGRPAAELKRLAAQVRLVDPITRRFLVSAVISEGMRVLEVGSGVGDVAILLASGRCRPSSHPIRLVLRYRQVLFCLPRRSQLFRAERDWTFAALRVQDQSLLHPRATMC